MTAPAIIVRNCRLCEQVIDDDKERYLDFYRDGKQIGAEHQKCFDVKEREEWKASGLLTTSLMMSNNLISYRREMHYRDLEDDIYACCQRLEEDVKRFDVEVWFGGADSVAATGKWEHEGIRLRYPRQADSLQSIIEDSPHRTIEAKLGNITVTGQVMAGRALVELESGPTRLTLITAEKEDTSRMGIQGIYGTEAECRRMLNEVRRGWRDLKFKKYKGD